MHRLQTERTTGIFELNLGTAMLVSSLNTEASITSMAVENFIYLTDAAETTIVAVIDIER